MVMKMIEMVSVDEIRPHPKNEYYFDDIQGDGWNDLLQSIRTSGVTNAITIDQRDMIISGHQRVRACKLLGIEEIPAHVIHYTDEELKKQKDVKDLIESNLKQRVPGNSNPVKLGRCFSFLKEYYGAKEGRPKKKPGNNFPVSKTVVDIAEENGVTKKTVNNLVRLSKAIPEIQELVETGKVSPTTALSILRQLPEEEQRKLASSLIESENRASNAKVQELINRIAEKDRKIADLENREPVIKIKEVPPKDYEAIKKDAKLAWNEQQRVVNELREVKSKLRSYESREGENEIQARLEKDADYLSVLTTDFLRKVGSFIWVPDRIEYLPEEKRKNLKKSIINLDGWCQSMLEILGGNLDEYK